MGPRSRVLGNLAEHADVLNRGRNFREISAIPTYKRGDSPDRWHPEIVEYDIGTRVANHRCKRKVYKYTVKFVVAVDENYAKTETRYAEVPFDIGGSARRGARVGDFTLGSLMKMWTREDLDLHGQRRECW